MEKIIKYIRTVLLVIFLIGTSISLFRIGSYILYMEATSFQRTLTIQRLKANPIELTAVVDRILDINKKVELYQDISRMTIKDVKIFDWLFIDCFEEMPIIK